MTDKQPTEAQIKEFWEWCGFTYEGDDVNSPLHRVIYTLDGHWFAGDVPIDLNSLFKYAVPKLLDKEYSITITVNVANSLGMVRDKFDKTPAIWKEAHRNNPALALFWAIYSLIGG